MPETLHILLVEDNPGDARLLRELLLEADSFDFKLTHVDRLAAAEQAEDGRCVFRAIFR